MLPVVLQGNTLAMYNQISVPEVPVGGHVEGHVGQYDDVLKEREKRVY